MDNIQKQKNRKVKPNLTTLFVSAIFAIMIIAWMSSAVMTVLPDSSASKVCHLGYKAHCSFTPFGTTISITAAAITYLIARKFNFLKF
ncbi:hypothetical protein ACFLRN_10355 [Thermoproteota archaeon]